MRKIFDDFFVSFNYYFYLCSQKVFVEINTFGRKVFVTVNTFEGKVFIKNNN